MKNFILCTVLPLEASEVNQIRKFYDFLDLTQFFQIWPDRVLIEMNDVYNFIYNNFKEKWPTPENAPFSLQEPLKLTKKGFFLQNGWILSTSEALGLKTVYPREFITNFKVVLNVIFDNFYSDQNTVWSNLKKLCKIWKIIKFVSLDNFGGPVGRTVQNIKFII